MNNQSGFGLSEVLISLFLASIILITLTQLYLSNKRQYLESQKVLEAKFELQWVSDLLTDSIRRAGFTPCLGVDQLKTMDMRKFGQSLSGLNVESSAGQLIQINRMSDVFSDNIDFRSSTELIVSKPTVVNEHHSLIIADCEHAEVHHVLKVEKMAKGQRITLAKPILYSYVQSAYVGEWLEEQWVIKPNSQRINTLHYQLGQTEEISSLIHSLNISEQRIHGKHLLKVVMGLAKDKTHELTVVVRGA